MAIWWLPPVLKELLYVQFLAYLGFRKVRSMVVIAFFGMPRPQCYSPGASW